MPLELWNQIFPKLQNLTLYDGLPWTIEWFNTSEVRRLRENSAAEFEQEQLVQMRALVNRWGFGSKLYYLNLSNEKIGCGGLSAV